MVIKYLKRASNSFRCLVFLLLFFFRSRKEIFQIATNREPNVKISLVNLFKILLGLGGRAEISFNQRKIKVFLENISDLTSVIEIFIHKIYGLSLINSGAKIIFDIGAYIGLFSLACSAINPKAKIYSFEPDPKSFQKLKKNLSLNKSLAKNILTYNFGFYSEKKWAEFNQYSFGAHNSLYHFYQPANKIKVRLESLGDYIKEKELNIDLIKIDVEGAEHKIFKSLQKYHFKKIKAILVEIHHLPKSKDKPSQLISFLKRFYSKVKHCKNVYCLSN